MSLTQQRHHFVPEFYQRGFIEDGSGLIWVCEKGRAPRQRSVKKGAGFEYNLYAFTHADGSVDVGSVEKKLADLDRDAAAVIRKIDGGTPITPEERKTLCEFIGVMYRRTPEHRRAVGDMAVETVPEAFERIEAEIFTPNFRIVDSLTTEQRHRLEQRYAEFLNVRANYSARPPDFLFPKLVVRDSVFQVRLENMDWAFFKSTKDTPFVTCDDPVIFNFSLSHSQGGVLFFPLSRHILLQAMGISTYGGAYQQLPDRKVHILNRHLVRNAKKQVYSGRRRPELAKFVNRWIGKGF